MTDDREPGCTCTFGQVDSMCPAHFPPTEYREQRLRYLGSEKETVYRTPVRRPGYLRPNIEIVLPRGPETDPLIEPIKELKLDLVIDAVVPSAMADPRPTRTRLELFRDLHGFLNGLGGALAECDCPMCSLRKDVAIYFRQAQQVAEARNVHNVMPDPEMEDTDVEVPQASAERSLASFARQLYEAYCESSGGKNFMGSACPGWDDLPETIRAHWGAVARRAKGR